MPRQTDSDNYTQDSLIKENEEAVFALSGFCLCAQSCHDITFLATS